MIMRPNHLSHSLVTLQWIVTRVNVLSWWRRRGWKLPLDIGEGRWRLRCHIGEPRLVIVLAENFILAQVESIPHTKSVCTLLTGETIEMIDVRPGSHDHLEGRYRLVAGRAKSGIPEEPEVVPLAEDKVGLRIKGRTDLA